MRCSSEDVGETLYGLPSVRFKGRQAQVVPCTLNIDHINTEKKDVASAATSFLILNLTC